MQYSILVPGSCDPQHVFGQVPFNMFKDTDLLVEVPQSGYCICKLFFFP